MKGVLSGIKGEMNCAIWWQGAEIICSVPFNAIFVSSEH